MKSNIEHLRQELDGLNTGGMLDLALEFVDGLENDIDELKEEVKNAEHEQQALQDRVDEAEEELSGIKESAFEPENLQEEMAFAAFNKFINRFGAMKAERILDQMNREPYLTH